MTVTLKPKRYRPWEWVFVCAGCGLLACSERSDAITCSTACRVKAHRGTWLKEVKALAKALHIQPADILHSKAIVRLRPDFEELVRDGKLTIEGAMPEVYREFIKAVFAAVEREV